MSPRNEGIRLGEPKHHVINPTNLCRALDDGVEDRLHVRRRAADDAEHLGRRRLMLQGLAQFCVALLDLLEEADVLDGDDRLVGESLNARYLFVRKGTDFQSTNQDIPDGDSLSKQGRSKNGTSAEAFLVDFGRWKLGF